MFGFQIKLKVPYLKVKNGSNLKSEPATVSYRIEAIVAKKA